MTKPEKQIIGKSSREFSFDRSTVKEDDRTVELAFSSEQPYPRFYGLEILDHKAASVRLGRLNDGGALLLNHDIEKQIGVVVDAKIESDRVGRAVVRFGKSALAEEIFQDVKDGIRTKVSVYYEVYAYALESKDADGNCTYRMTDWEPIEVSIVSIPADNSVGVGRALEPNIQEKEIKMPPENQTTAPLSVDPMTAARAAEATAMEAKRLKEEAIKSARSEELSRINDLENLGSQFLMYGGPALAREFISNGKSVGELQSAILDKVGKSKPVQNVEIGMEEKELNRYSFLRALNFLANPTSPQAREMAAFELECSAEAVKKRGGSAAKGLLVPVDVLKQKRDLTVGSNTGGGYTVATDLLAASMIDMLRNKLAVVGMGATMMGDLVGNVAIPRQTSSATAYWVAEGSAPTESQQAVDQVTLSPKTVGAYTDYSRKLFLQSSIDVENFVRNDLLKILALELDRAALYGTGSTNQPLGVKNTSGINTIDFAGATPTFAEIVQFETELAADNADINTMSYLTNATMRGALKSAVKVSAQAIYIWEDDEMNGYAARASNQVESGDVWFANWSDLIIGMWSGLDLMIDPYANATSGGVRTIALQDVDVAVRHPVSFCRGNNTL